MRAVTHFRTISSCPFQNNNLTTRNYCGFEEHVSSHISRSLILCNSLMAQSSCSVFSQHCLIWTRLYVCFQVTFSSTLPLSLLKLPDYYHLNLKMKQKKKINQKKMVPSVLFKQLHSDGLRTLLCGRFFCRKKKRGILSVVSCFRENEKG